MGTFNARLRRALGGASLLLASPAIIGLAPTADAAARRQNGAGDHRHGRSHQVVMTRGHRGPRGIVRVRGRPARVATQRPRAHAASAYAFPAGYKDAVNTFFADVAHDSSILALNTIYDVATQYWDGQSQFSGVQAAYGSSFPGANTYTDTSPLPAPYPSTTCTDGSYADCITDAQIQHEIDAVATQQGWPRGAGSVFFLLTPPGLGSCADSTSTDCFGVAYGYCGYHNDFASPSGETIYANLPDAAVAGCQNDPSGQTGNHLNTDGADATLSVLSHEHIEMITDPEGSAPGTLSAWYDATTGEEIADKCAFDYGAQSSWGGSPQHYSNETINNDPYFLQSEWSNNEALCQLGESNPPATASSGGSGGTGLAYHGGPVLHANTAYVIYWEPRGTLPSATLTVGAGSPFYPGAAIPFAASSGDSTATFSWSFGDGSAPAAGPSLTHAYAGPGTYPVTLTATNQAGSTTATKFVTVKAHIPPVAAFNAFTSAPTAGDQVSFDGGPSSDTDGGGVVAWSWSFGDGATATGQQTNHVYAVAGAKTVALTVTDAAGLSATTSQTINVQPPPVALKSVSVNGRQTLRSVLAHGIRLTVQCTQPCNVASRVLLPTSARKAGRMTVKLVEIGHAASRTRANGAADLVIKITRTGARRLRAAHNPQLVVLTDAAGQEIQSRLRLR